MAYTRTYDSKWVFTLDRLGPMMFARIAHGDTAYELITVDTTMLHLLDMGYEPQITYSDEGEPWIVWKAAGRSAAYGWVCSAGVAAWSTYVTN